MSKFNGYGAHETWMCAQEDPWGARDHAADMANKIAKKIEQLNKKLAALSDEQAKWEKVFKIAIENIQKEQNAA